MNIELPFLSKAFFTMAEYSWTFIVLPMADFYILKRIESKFPEKKLAAFMTYTAGIIFTYYGFIIVLAIALYFPLFFIYDNLR